MTNPEDNPETIQSLKATIEQLTQELQTKEQELESTQKLLQQQNKFNSLGKNIAYIIHDIRSPLGAINLTNLLSLQLIQNLLVAESLSEQQSTLTQLLNNSHLIKDYFKKANNIIDSLIREYDSSELDSSDLTEVITQSLDMTIASFKVENDWTIPLEIETDFDDDEIPTQLYLSDFERAICNLINNSLYSLKQKQIINPKFTPRLSLSVEQLERQLRIIIEDNGEGIKPEDESKIFEEFYTTKGNQGTGIGLFLVKQIIEEQHQGTLTLETSYGDFARFIITL